MNYKDVEEGDWIFTCSMHPLQFKEWIRDKERGDYGEFTDEKWEEFSQWDDFQTIEGSHHSRKNCSLSPITNGYAKWFNDNKIWELFPDDKTSEQWETYEKAVKEACIRDGILYEGF